MARGRKKSEFVRTEGLALHPDDKTDLSALKKRGRKSKDELAQLEQSYFDKDNGELPDVYLAEVCAIIGKSIRFNRKLRKFSIDNLSDYLELSSSYVGLLERGERCPSLKTLLKICELFSITLGDLLVERQTTSHTAALVIGENKKQNLLNKQKSIMSLLQRLNDNELDFVVNLLKAMKSMQKRNEIEGKRTEKVAEEA